MSIRTTVFRKRDKKMVENISVRQLFKLSHWLRAGLPSLPVFQLDYPFFTTSTHLPVFYTSTRFWDSDFQKDFVVFLPVSTGEIRKKNRAFYESKHFIYTKQQSKCSEIPINLRVPRECCLQLKLPVPRLCCSVFSIRPLVPVWPRQCHRMTRR